MDFELTAEQKMFRDTARTFAEQEIIPTLRDNERQEKFDPALIKKMAAKGLLAPHMPQEYGGMGLDYLSAAIIWESLCGASLAVTQAAISGPIQPATNLLDAGNEAQKQKYLPAVCAGELIMSGAVVEPNAGSDSSLIETTAVREGNKWIINGSKIFITNGDIADVVLFIAQTDKTKGLKGLATFLVEKDTPGFSRTPMTGKISWRGGSEGALYFTDMVLPLENQVGETGRALRDALRGIDTARLFLAAGAVGLAQSCLDASIKYARERVQFGKPIGGHQLIQEIIADMATRIEAARWLTYRVADMKSRGIRHIKEMSYAKYFASETALWVATQAVKIHGSYGTFDEYPVGHHYQDAVTATILGGTAQMHQLTIGQQLLEMAAFR
ncbi:acyl-CoA dehydrogenase family protein [candidate division CSSED10-310 bacterium]|uniref:Acyl-CoA dehydrogenase family protein n=1 Tax=candidate division CSSED10-310 bacterium TaxID=2855610 RepID=A0ABV6Z325_UNCC1